MRDETTVAARLRKQHRKSHGVFCLHCHGAWPCHTVQTLDAADAMARALKRCRRALAAHGPCECNSCLDCGKAFVEAGLALATAHTLGLGDNDATRGAK